MTICAITGMELFYIISTILVGTIAINVAIAFLRQRWSNNKQRIAFDAHWERKIDEEEAEEETRQKVQLRRQRANSSASSTRGFLASLVTRAQFVDGKVTEDDMKTYLRDLLREIRQKYDEVAYLGNHTAKGRENDACLYGRYRVNGVTKCIGEIASMQQTRHGVQLIISLTSTDAALVQERGWGVPSQRNAANALSTLFCATTTTREMVMPIPRSLEELRTVTQPVLEAAVCSVAGVEILA